jgi:hypothetical protein
MDCSKCKATAIDKTVPAFLDLSDCFLAKNDWLVDIHLEHIDKFVFREPMSARQHGYEKPEPPLYVTIKEQTLWLLEIFSSSDIRMRSSIRAQRRNEDFL